MTAGTAFRSTHITTYHPGAINTLCVVLFNGSFAIVSRARPGRLQLHFQAVASLTYRLSTARGLSLEDQHVLQLIRLFSTLQARASPAAAGASASRSA